MVSGGSSSHTTASGQTASDLLVEWKRLAVDALNAREASREKLRKKGANSLSSDELDAEAGRLAKSLQRLHPAAIESISATVSGTKFAKASFDRTLKTLAGANSQQ